MGHYIDNYLKALPPFLKQNQNDENVLTRIVIVEKYNINPWICSGNLIEDLKKDMDYFRAKMFNCVGIPSKYFEI